jgi:arginine-tRNA-protein transferase
MREIDDLINETSVLQPLHPVIFDDLMAEGWRLLGQLMARHNYGVHEGALCRTIPLRIVMDRFEQSKSQRKLMRQNEGIHRTLQPIRWLETMEIMFEQHAERFTDRRPQLLENFIGDQAHRLPVPGWQFDLHRTKAERAFAHSFFHVGEKSICSTYCIYNPDFQRYSPGIYTMLLELELCQTLHRDYYYLGYIYDVPSKFDYKLGFYGTEFLDWKTGSWIPLNARFERPDDLR